MFLVVKVVIGFFFFLDDGCCVGGFCFVVIVDRCCSLGAHFLWECIIQLSHRYLEKDQRPLRSRVLRKSTVTSQLLAPCNNTIARAKSRIPTKDESGIIRLSVSRFRVFAQSLGMNESEELYSCNE